MRQVQRTLAGAGASASQLELLGGDGRDAELTAELAWIAFEAVWQLRAVTRQAHRRWQLVADEVFPTWLQQWLSEADALSARHLTAS